MEKAEHSARRHSLWATAAVIAPLAHAASLTEWLPAILMAAVALLIGKWVRLGTGWLLTVQRLWSSVIIATVMHWSSAYWPDLPIARISPLLLLALAVWTVSVPGKASRIGCVLLWPLIFLLGAVLLSGTSEINLEYLLPTGKEAEPLLFTVLLIPALGKENKVSKNLKLGVAAVVVSVITVGVLSPAVAGRSQSGIYEMSRSLSFLGMAERFESIVAAAMTMGFYGVITYLMETGRQPKEKVWAYAIPASALYLFKIQFSAWILALGSLLAWVVLPLLAKKNNLKK